MPAAHTSYQRVLAKQYSWAKRYTAGQYSSTNTWCQHPNATSSECLNLLKDLVDQVQGCNSCCHHEGIVHGVVVFLKELQSTQTAAAAAVGQRYVHCHAHLSGHAAIDQRHR